METLLFAMQNWKQKRQEAAKEVYLIGKDYFPEGTTSKYKR